MKRVVFLLLVLITTFSALYAQRGDIISAEVIQDWDSEEAAENYWQIISSHIPPAEQDSFKVVFGEIMTALTEGKRIVSYRVIYKTIDHYGNPTQASGLVILPVHDGKSCNLPIFYYGHGTIFSRFSAPSRPENWGTERFFVYMSAALNFIGVAPDYYGLGDGPGFHHHNSAQTNSTSGIDMIRAARNLARQQNIGNNSQVFISGYSEGGHNAMGMIKMINDQNLRSEFNVVSAGCGSGAYDEYDLQYHFIVDNPYYPTRQYILYIVATCEDIYGNLINEAAGETVSTYLKAPYDSLYNVHLLGQDGQLEWVPLPWTDLLKPGVLETVTSNPAHPLRQCLKQSNLYDWPNPFRTSLYYVKTDQQVYWKNSPKAKLAQWKYIPWYKFWDKARIATHDMTNKGAVQSHEEGAIPIMLHYMIYSNMSKIMDCDSVGRVAYNPPGYMLNYDKTADIPWNAFGDLQKAEIIDFSDFSVSSISFNNDKANGVCHLNLKDINPAAYILRLTGATGNIYYRGLIYDEPQFLEDENYDPVVLAEDGSYLLDMTLLEDKVSKVIIYSIDGKKINTFEDPFAVQKLSGPGELDGEYVIEIHGKEMRYYVKMATNRKKLVSSATVFPNPFSNVLTVKNKTGEISNIRVFNAEGKEFTLPPASVNNRWEINTSSLPAGIYLIEITGPDGTRTEKAIKF